MATANNEKSTRRKLALIIANGNYSREKNRLTHATKNATDLSNVLKRLNFKVTIYMNSDIELIMMIIDFSKTIQDGDLVFVYYVGHTHNVNNENYMIPIDDEVIQEDLDILDSCPTLKRAVERLVDRNPSYATIFVVDCCRPYTLDRPRSSKSSVHRKRLQTMEAPPGSFIQFASNSKQTVNEVIDADQHCLFMKHLLRNIIRENVHIVDMFRDIVADVYQQSNQQQKPLSLNGLRSQHEVYLNEVDKLSTEKYISKQPLSRQEIDYYDECKEYYRATQQPLIIVADEFFDNNTRLTSTSLKFGIDEECSKFNLREFLNTFCKAVNISINDVAVKKIQSGSSILEADIFDNCGSENKRIKLKMIYECFTEQLKQKFGKIKMFFMFMGPIKALQEKQKHRADLRLNPEFNRKYAKNHTFWYGAINDGIDRGDKPYYCPVGWQRWSFYVTDNFREKFRGWSICYHGTKFAHGLSILLSGLKPAHIKAHGEGIYATPSINYAAHPRYSEVKQIEPSCAKRFFGCGRYVQFVLECRVLPQNIKKIAQETLGVRNVIIDRNISDDEIEWVIDHKNKSIVDFNDPDSTVICTGILTRITDKHPGLLPESRWWFSSHLCNRSNCCLLGTDLSSLERDVQRGETCEIIFN